VVGVVHFSSHWLTRVFRPAGALPLLKSRASRALRTFARSSRASPTEGVGPAPEAPPGTSAGLDFHRVSSVLIPVLVLPLFSFGLGILLPEQVRFTINASFCSVAHRTRCATSSPAPSLIFLELSSRFSSVRYCVTSVWWPGASISGAFSRAALPGEFLVLGFLVFSVQLRQNRCRG
jgi:hypothetical protein